MKLTTAAPARPLMPARVRYAALSYAALGCALASVMVGALVARPKPAPVTAPPAVAVEAAGPLAFAAPMPASLPVLPAPEGIRPEERSRAVELEPPAPAAPATRTFTRPHESPPPPAAAPAPAAIEPPNTAMVAITDHGFVPDRVAIKAGGAIVWANEGSVVHTATAVGPVRPFDTGGLAAHQNAKATLVTPGTYAYSSAPDCLNGNRSRQFDCAASFAVTVIGG